MAGMTYAEALSHIGQLANTFKALRRAEDLLTALAGAEQALAEKDALLAQRGAACAAADERLALATARAEEAERDSAARVQRAKADADAAEADARARADAARADADGLVAGARTDADKRVAEIGAEIAARLAERDEMQTQVDELRGQIAAIKAKLG